MDIHFELISKPLVNTILKMENWTVKVGRYQKEPKIKLSGISANMCELVGWDLDKVLNKKLVENICYPNWIFQLTKKCYS